MANRLHIPAKEIRGNSAALNEFMRRILAVPHSEIKAALEAEKAEKRTHIRHSASRDSGASPKRAT